MNTAEILRKTAGVLRTQEEEKAALSKKVGTLEKESQVNRAVINMVKEGILEADEVDSKIAEFQSNPKLLEETVNFFDKSANVGEINPNAVPTEGDAEGNFFSGLQS
jgi:hypothetical protein